VALDVRDQLQDTLGDAYILERELGGGAMSRVFVATESSLSRKIVVKVLPPEMAAAVRIDRFRREIQLAANLQHPHIVPLLSAGETNGLPYFIMPFVRGESLRDRLVREGELPVADAVRILREVASALAYAHENGIVHRDIKPENVLISGGAAVVTDFGVAKALSSATIAGVKPMTGSGVLIGTPAYMAPEQASADTGTDHRADIYALGVMGYEMLAGSSPFHANSAQSMLVAHLTQVPESLSRQRPSVPPALAQIIMCCLEKRPADRFQTAAEVVRQLDAIKLGSSSGDSWKAFGLTSGAGGFRRHPVTVIALVAGVLVAGVSATLWTRAHQTAKASGVNALSNRYYPNGSHRESVPPPLWLGKVSQTLAAYALAIKTGNVAEIGKIHTTMTKEQKDNWNLFFQQSRSIDATLQLENASGNDSSAEATVVGLYTIVSLAGDTQNIPVKFRASLRADGRDWHIVSLRDTVTRSSSIDSLH
jgi:serine/threonine protein kinase